MKLIKASLIFGVGASVGAYIMRNKMLAEFAVTILDVCEDIMEEFNNLKRKSFVSSFLFYSGADFLHVRLNVQ